jgi:hypothetical protein
MRIDEYMNINRQNFLSDVSDRMLAYSKQHKKDKESEEFAEYIWYMYGAIQNCIMKDEYDVERSGDSVLIHGTIDVGEWEVQFILNPHDNHRPDIESENAVPYCNDEEIWLNYTFNDYSDDAMKKMEKLYGFEFKSMVNLFGGGGKFPKKVTDAIDESEI